MQFRHLAFSTSDAENHQEGITPVLPSSTLCKNTISLGMCTSLNSLNVSFLNQ